MNEDNIEAVCDSSVLNVTVDGVVQMFKNHEEEMQKLDQRKWSLEAEMEHLKKLGQCLEMEKSEIEDDIERLKQRNVIYQKEHTNLRNSITVVKFQIEKIKESIEVAKANDCKALEDFEKAVDEITEKFRLGPASYDRKILLEKIEKEKEKKELLIKKLEEIKELHENFSKANGLRVRQDHNKELLSCILPGSALSCFIEMTKTLDEVICEIKNLAGDLKLDEKKLEDLDVARNKLRKQNENNEV